MFIKLFFNVPRDILLQYWPDWLIISLGVWICLDRVSIETLDLDSREDLDTLKILVSMIENSWSRSRYLDLVLLAICKSNTSWLRSRLVETFVIICDFCGFLDIFLDLNKEIMDFYNYLDQDFSSQPFLFTFCGSKLASKWAISVRNSIFFKKLQQKSQSSQKITRISIYLDDLN